MNPDTPISANRKSQTIGYLASFVITLTVVLIFTPGDWYLAANKPIWAPPGWLLTLLWVASCALLAVLAWQARDATGIPARWAMYRLILAILLFWVWWWLFFGLHRIGWSIAIQTIAVLVTATLLGRGNLSGRMGRWLLLLWCGYLWVLNYLIWTYNGGGLSGF